MLYTADTTIVNQITWPHEVSCMCLREPVVYKELDSMTFINGYITVMAREPEHMKSRMHLMMDMWI